MIPVSEPMDESTWDAIVSFMKRLTAFYDVNDAHRWMCSPHIDLNHKTPIDLVRAGRSDEVDAIIDRLESGAYI